MRRRAANLERRIPAFGERRLDAKLRAHVVPQGPLAHAPAATEAVAAGECDLETVQGRARRIGWARLLKRVFDIDMQRCPRCGARDAKVIAAILERSVIGKILTHLGWIVGRRRAARRARRGTSSPPEWRGPSAHAGTRPVAITTSTEESVRRAMAIPLIINREWGLAKNENPLQGGFVVDELTELVEEAVLAEFERISERGGVLGAMETGYQRGKIQDESMHYEHLKHTGEYPIVGVNTFRNPHGDPIPEKLELARSTEEEKRSQLARLEAFHERHAAQAPAMLRRLQDTVIADGNVFEVLMDAVRVCSLGQITNAPFEVGGQCRTSM